MPTVAGRSGFPLLGRPSHASGWNASNARPDGIPANRLHAVRPGRAAAWPICLWRKRPLRRVPILRFFNRAGLPGLLHRLLAGAGARPALLAEHTCSTFRYRACGCSSACKTGSTAWNPSPTIVFPAATRNSPSWRGGAAAWYRTGCFGSIWPTLRPSFLLQFIFDTTIRSTCWPGPPLAAVLICGRPVDLPETVRKGLAIWED